MIQGEAGMIKQLRLPDGTYTTDVDQFSAEWDKLRKPFEAMGFYVIGFDPGLALCDNTNEFSMSFELPIYAARRIIEALGKTTTKDTRTITEKTLLPIEQTSWARMFKRIQPGRVYDEAINRATSPNFAVKIVYSTEIGDPVWAVEAVAEEDKADDGGFWMEAFPTKYKALDFCEKMKWRVV